MATTNGHSLLSKKSQSGFTTWQDDKFTIRDGHYVGHDGFIVPKDFSEFFARFPRYVSHWVCRTTRKRATDPDAEDLTQELLLHLQRLPNESKFRVKGKQDVIQTFDPRRMHGSNEARFRSFINLCLANKFKTLFLKDNKNPICRPGTLTFGVSKDDDSATASDEYCHNHSRHLQDQASREAKKLSDDQRIDELLTRQCQQKLKEVVGVYRATGSWREVAQLVGVKERQCCLASQQLRTLSENAIRARTAERS